MTDKAAKVLALFRNGKRWQEMSTFQGRSFEALIREGFLREIKCGKCVACSCKCTCERYDLVLIRTPAKGGA